MKVSFDLWSAYLGGLVVFQVLLTYVAGKAKIHPVMQVFMTMVWPITLIFILMGAFNDKSGD